MTAAIATATVRIEPELDLTALGASIRATVATELRRIADELHGLDADAQPEEPKAPRYVLVVDAHDDYGIHDTELDIVADYMTENRDSVAPDVDRLNAGTLNRRDVRHSWVPRADAYPPYTPAD